MAAGDRSHSPDSVDRVMNQVLAAEQEAREAVEQCRAEAAQILAEAEDNAREIERRAERRLRLTDRIADRAVEAALRELRTSGSGAGAAMPDSEAGAVLDRAVDALVDEILGGPA
jgi:vacuolar-type H+-ATPase subunit H